MSISSLFLTTLAVTVLASSAMAGSALTIRDAAQKAITTNPEVEARWHAFLAATDEQGSARAGFLPRVDLSAGIGREQLNSPTLSGSSYTRSNTTLSLTQMLYDGQATKSDIERLGYTRLVRYYEVLDAAEATALEVLRAYVDVQRFRELVSQARDNYAQHKLLFDQVKQRAESGVGRRVDLELAGGRLALAESNLLTEAANLHDVSARYQRLTGELPGEDLANVEFSTAGLPDNLAEVLKKAYSGNPGLNAATESIRTAQADLRNRDSAMKPRVDFRLRDERGRNIDGILGSRDSQVAEVLFNFNLYKGGGDRASQRQFAQRLNQARDLRDKSCRDLRQTLSIAHNDIARLNEQLGYLNDHRNAIAKARVAYRQQFDIGQRTLLDLLDIQNEYFQSHRSYTSASYDLQIARARTLSGMGRLLTALQISRDDMPMADEAAPDRAGSDPVSVCPPEGPEMLQFDKQAILTEALKSWSMKPFPAKGPAVVVTMTPPASAPSPKPAPKPASKATPKPVPKPAQKPAPEPAPDPADVPAMVSDNWFSQQNPASYVLQIIVTKSQPALDKFVQTQGLKGCHSYTRTDDGRQVLTCGLYANRFAARQAVAKLPDAARIGDPIPSRIDDILDSMQP